MPLYYIIICYGQSMFNLFLSMNNFVICMYYKRFFCFRMPAPASQSTVGSKSPKAGGRVAGAAGTVRQRTSGKPS